jgi:hypothetical protein
MRLHDTYEEIHRLVDRSPEAFIEMGFHIEDLLKHCDDLLDDVEMLVIPESEELYYLTKKMLLILRRGHSFE